MKLVTYKIITTHYVVNFLHTLNSFFLRGSFIFFQLFPDLVSLFYIRYSPFALL